MKDYIKYKSKINRHISVFQSIDLLILWLWWFSVALGYVIISFIDVRNIANSRSDRGVVLITRILFANNKS